MDMPRLFRNVVGGYDFPEEYSVALFPFSSNVGEDRALLVIADGDLSASVVFDWEWLRGRPAESYYRAIIDECWRQLRWEIALWRNASEEGVPES